MTGLNLLFNICSLLCFVPLSLGVVPLPYYTLSSDTATHGLSEDLDIKHDYPKCDMLNLANKNLQKYLFNAMYKKYVGEISTTISSINIIIKNGCEDHKDKMLWPSAAMDESYDITVTGDGISIITKEVWGVLRAYATLFQLVFRNDAGTLLINKAVIYDKPRFYHRGFMIDSSRHFLPIRIILETLKLMFLNKINVLHWHIVDDQSFPYQSYSFPNMSEFGSFHRYSHVYTQSDIGRILHFARVRGIRIIPEFDSPGHSLSWGKGITNLLTPCYSGAKPNGNYGPMDPTVETTFNFLKVFFTEIDAVFPDNFIHLGGDEVDFNCWKSNPTVANFTKKHGFPNDYAKLQQYFFNRLIDIVKKISTKGSNLRTLVWQEVFDQKNNVTKESTIVHVWKSGWQTEIGKVTEAGYTAILSSPWYLNYINYGIDWKPLYTADPQNFTNGDPNLVVGGEACMWGEYVDETNIIARSWPRVSVVAERLWSNKSVTDQVNFSQRLNDFRCRLLINKFEVETTDGPGTYCNRPGFIQ